MKKVLLLQSRPEDEASDGEYEAFCRLGGIDPSQVVRLRLDHGDLATVNLDDYGAVLMGGGPANLAYDDDHKSESQKRMETWLYELLDQIRQRDMPFLGVCLGFGIAVKSLGGEIRFDFSEDVGAVTIEQTVEGKGDPLLDGIPQEFLAFVGHKEGARDLPPGAVELARSAACSQMLRIGKNMYATQFHPELDVPGIVLRVNVYQHAGYFHPEERDDLIAHVSSCPVEWPEKILQNFVKRYL